MAFRNKTIGLISAVPLEGKDLVKRLHLKPIKKARRDWYSGRYSEKELIYCVSGIGKTNAAHAATIMTERYLPSVIIVFGIGGAYHKSGLKVGDLAVAASEIYADEGVMMPDGIHGYELIGIPLLKRGKREFFNEVPLDRRLSGKALKAARLVANAKAGKFLTVSACTGTKKRAAQLQAQFGAICENMEGAAAAHICMLHGIPSTEIRGISNIVENRDTSRWDIGTAARNCQSAVLEILDVFGKI